MKRKDSIVIGVLLLTIVALIIINKGTTTYQSPLKSNEIKEYNDNNIIAMNIQDSNNLSNYNESTNMPDPTKYVINSSKSYCTKGIQGEKDTNVEMKTVSGNHVFNNLAKNDRCFLYFDLAPLTVPDILAKYTKDNSRSGEITAGFKESTPTTVYSKEDDYGTSYVFAGVNPNNWVRIGNFYFRIIRFNGNGSMRLIYSGNGSAETSGEGTQIGSHAFNTNYDNNMYVGLQYTHRQVHGVEWNSTILGETNSTDTTTLYGWYNGNIKNIYGSLIDNSVGFCSDRDNYTNDMGTVSGGGIGTTITYYGAYIRYRKGNSWQTTYDPVLKCKEASDLLKLPVGLITADEYALAGGGAFARDDPTYFNEAFWLHTGQIYWTMTPETYCGSAYVFIIQLNGCLYSYRADYSDGDVRPVINLKSTATFESNGTGEANNPYILKIN